MKKIIYSNLTGLITLLVSAAVIYYFLLHENFMHLSIACIINNSHHLADRQHIVVLGLLPIYIAIIIFGTTVAAFSCSRWLRNVFYKQQK